MTGTGNGVEVTKGGSWVPARWESCRKEWLSIFFRQFLSHVSFLIWGVEWCRRGIFCLTNWHVIKGCNWLACTFFILVFNVFFFNSTFEDCFYETGKLTKGCNWLACTLFNFNNAFFFKDCFYETGKFTKGCNWLACTHTGYSLTLVPVTAFLPRKVWFSFQSLEFNCLQTKVYLFNCWQIKV